MNSSEIKKKLEIVEEQMRNAIKRRNKEINSISPRLVAVSKTQPKELIIEAYNCGQRHFGENYIQELYDKSNDKEIIESCPQIKWHAIGHIQTNKVNKLLGVRNLFLVETIDSEKLALTINNGLNKSETVSDKLKVMIQINTSQEINKSGINASDAINLVEFIREKCENLQFFGLMAIGAYDYDTSKGPNPDFQKLLSCRQDISERLGIPIESIELSFGMSSDYELAIEMGSTNVRVGSAIFGERKYN